MSQAAHTPDQDPTTTPESRSREAWLQKAIDIHFRPMFAQIGYTIPETIHVSVGWGYGRASAESKNIAGQCWSGMASEDSFPHIFISPMMVDPAEVLGTLAHELVHATLDPIMDHGKDFKILATAVGLVGPMTATTADMSTGMEYMLMAEDGGELGPYPHSMLSVLVLPDRAKTLELVGGPPQRITSGPAPQVARWVRVVCPNHPGAPSVRTARATVGSGRSPLCGEPIDEIGTPCATRMVL